MSETNTGHRPEEREQLSSFFKGLRETRKLPHDPDTVQKAIIIGLMTIAPTEVRNSGILTDPHRLAAIDAITAYQVGLNDKMDFEGSNRTDIDDIVEEARQLEIMGETKLKEALAALPETTRMPIEANLAEAIKEIEHTESWIRNKRDNNDVTFQDSEAYRNIVNAISNVAISSVLFGPEKLKDRTQPIEEPLEIDKISDKYSWILGSNPSSEVDRVIMIMHNVGMIAQIVDDWHDRDIDTALSIPTVATTALDSANGDASLAKAFLWRRMDDYKGKARELGLSKIGTESVTRIVSYGKFGANFLVQRGRGSEKIRDFVNKHHGHIREDRWMRGELDLKTTE